MEAVRQLESIGVTDLTIGAPPDVTGAQALQRIVEARRRWRPRGTSHSRDFGWCYL